MRTSGTESQLGAKLLQFGKPALMSGRSTRRALMWAAAIMAGFVFMLSSAPVARATCDSPTAVNDTATLNAAIVDFNGKSAPCAFEITLTGNITLSAHMEDITNNTAGVTLSVNGANIYNAFSFGSGVVASVNTITVTQARNEGIYISSGQLTITDVSVLENNQVGGFGGIYNFNGAATILNSTISANNAPGVSNGLGTMTIAGSLIEGSASFGIENSAALTVTAGTVIRGNANVGILNSGTLYVSDSYIHDNSKGIETSTSLVLKDSTISGHTGAGIVSFGGTFQVNNSTISGNQQGVRVGTDTKATVLNATLTGNEVNLLVTGVATVTNSILANAVSDDCALNDPGASVVFQYSLIEGSTVCPTSGTGNLTGVDPLLGALEDNGGSTPTHALGAGSPAINSGDNASAAAAGLTSDQRGPGFLRVSGPAVDMGAFEAQLFDLTAARSGSGTGTVTSNPAGINCGADCSELYPTGTVVTLTATAGVTSTFTGWSGAGCSGTGTCLVTVDAAKEVTATFILQTFPLTVTKAGNGVGTVTSSPVGIDCGADCSETYTAATTVTLTATAAITSTFTGWSGGGCSGTGACVVTMDAAKDVTATFATSIVFLPFVADSPANLTH